MTDPTQWLLSLPDQEHTLWCAGEGVSGDALEVFSGKVVTNRYDQWLTLKEARGNGRFNDFDLSGSLDDTIRRMVFLVAKEKRLNLHLLDSFLVLGHKGLLLSIFGQKQQGIHSLIKYMKALGVTCQTTRYQGQWFQVDFQHQPGTSDLSAYTELTPIGETGILTKPGIYGFDKIDKGSELLISAFRQFLTESAHRENITLLDLGCGNGYLSVKAKEAGCQRIDATDNCAGAIIACKANFEKFGITGEITADHCAAKNRKHYDIILCNPPFHQGFTHDRSLTDLFALRASQRIKQGGVALFVVNAFIGMESILKKHFTSCEILVRNKSYKVLKAKP